MEWSLLSPSSNRSEINSASNLCEVKDEQSHLFPSKPIPGMIEHFQPLLNTIEKCMGSCPIALAEDVEILLKKDYPNVISDQKLISFTEYAYLARLRGIPIHFNQEFGKIKYMWFGANSVDSVPNKRGNNEDNRLDKVVKPAKAASILEKITSEIEEYNKRCFYYRQEYTSQTFDYIPESWQKASNRRTQIRRYDRSQISTIMGRIIEGKHEFCDHQDLLYLVEVFVTLIILRPSYGSIICALELQHFIYYYFPSILGPSQEDALQRETFENLLHRLSKEESGMPITFFQDGKEIDISEMIKLVNLYKEER